MTLAELEREVQDVTVELLLARCCEKHQTVAERRALRVMRELARRDYSNRPHGRRCTCSECLALLGVWRSLQRTTIHHPDLPPE